MALQKDTLVMFGLPVQGDTPPNSIQPALINGIHLRWSMPISQGYPWHGFYLFRRAHRTGDHSPLRLSSYLDPSNGGPPLGEYPASTLVVGPAALSSDLPLNFTNSFPAQNTLEVDLNRGSYVEYTILSGPTFPCYRIRPQIGFIQSGTVTVTALYNGVPLSETQVTGTAGSVTPLKLVHDRISSLRISRGPAVLVDVLWASVQVLASENWQEIPGFSGPLSLPVFHPAYPCTPGQGEDYVKARLKAYARVVYGSPPAIPPSPPLLPGTLKTTMDSPVVVGSGTSWTSDLCGATLLIEGDPSAYTIATVLGPQKLVLNRAYPNPGAANLKHRISTEPFGELYDHLVTLIARGPTAGPMGSRGLPTPPRCDGSVKTTQGSELVTGSWTMWDASLEGLLLHVAREAGGSLVVTKDSADLVGIGTSWGEELVGMTLQLSGEPERYSIVRVDSPTRLTLSRPYLRPSASGRAYLIFDRAAYRIAKVNNGNQLQLERPYAEASVNGRPFLIMAGYQAEDEEQTVAIQQQYPLDLTLLGALNPALAQMAGLYWVDTSPIAGARYDYIVVADYLGTGNRDAKKVLSDIRSGNFSAYEASIVYDKQLGPSVPLAAPDGLEAYALPGSAPGGVDELGGACAGLRWNAGTLSGWALLPDRPVLHHLWRADLGLATPGAPPAASAYQLRTQDRPLLVVEPQLPPGAVVQRPADWPPFALHAIESKLAYGWYSYKVSGVDIFGRHSLASAPAEWYQWSPPPAPLPWYYQDPPTHHAVHAYALALLDQTGPPPPTGVEAYALDHADPLVVQDAAYNAWRATLSPAEQASLVGLRVRWLWTHAHMAQAPDTREFRIYYHPGQALPGGAGHDPLGWQQRFYVVDYAQHVTLTQDDEGRPLRIYEVLLPAVGDSPRAGVPLAPSLASPVDYALVGVSAADDKSYAPDRRTTGGWSGRTGNEGVVGPAMTIWRVLRQPPVVPELPSPQPARIYATPADYHGRSYTSYRWLPLPHLHAQIYRALDEAIFQRDWAQRPRPALSAGATGVFPAHWNSAKRQQVADALNALNAFAQTPAGTLQALAAYRALADDALRVLAGLAGNEAAFTLLTSSPLSPADPANADRRGPDDPPNYQPQAGLRAYLDTLDGRASNRYLYRAAYVDGAHNRSAQLSLASAPVWLPDVVAPRSPVISRLLGGERQVSLCWASNREPDLAEYRVYRAESEDAARDLRLMTLVHSRGVPAGDPAARPAELQWDDAPVPALKPFYYRIVAVDQAGNRSEPTPMIAASAHRSQPPAPPEWQSAEYLEDAATPQVRLRWSSSESSLRCIPQRRAIGRAWFALSPALEPGAPGSWEYIDTTAEGGLTYEYRVQAIDEAGNINLTFNIMTVDVPLS